MSPSFLRVGHMDLFGRRARGDMGRDRKLGVQQLNAILLHAVFREYPHLLDGQSVSSALRLVFGLALFSRQAALSVQLRNVCVWVWCHCYWTCVGVVSLLLAVHRWRKRR